MIANANLVGGPVWHEERLISRLRLLLHENFEVETSLKIDDQVAFWEQHSGMLIEVFSGSRSFRFPANDFLVDLKELRRTGRDHATVWWHSESSDRWWQQDWDGSDGSIRQFYLRTDTAYEELILTNFRAVASDLPNFLVMPRSWEIFVTPRTEHFFRLGLKALWHPVSKQQEVQVSVRRDETDSEQQSESERWFKATSTQLSKLGRRVTAISYSSGFAPTFTGESLVGIYDGKTAVLRAVCARLRREIGSQFNSIERFPLHVPPFD